MLRAPDDDRWDDPAIPRLADPELRSRLTGYLGEGWIARPGYRTDGTWVWPESLASRVRTYGFGPRQDLLDHIVTQGILIPARVPQEGYLAARFAGGLPLGPPDAGPSAQYFGVATAAGGVPTELLRVQPATGGWAPRRSWLTPGGWRGVDDGPTGVARPSGLMRELSRAGAADLADQLSRAWNDELRVAGRESDASGVGPRVARVYDAVTVSGQPTLSPGRVRIIERERRDRLVHYLSNGRLVLRAAGRMPDPLTNDPAPAVPLSFRTDGAWVWPEAIAYYLGTRGVAPELDLLCHIEEQGTIPPTSVADDVARQAGIVATRPVTPRQRAMPRYHLSATADLYRQRGQQARAELLGTDLRWHRCAGDWELPWAELVEIGEAEAAREIDARWARTAD